MQALLSSTMAGLLRWQRTMWTGIGLVLLVLGAPLTVQAQLPSDFVDESVLAGLSQPVSLAFLPDGRLLILQKGGSIVIADPAQSWSTGTYMTITNINSGYERGLLDLTLDPDFEVNGYFYLYYSPASPEGFRIARFTHQENSGGVTSTGDYGSEFVVWTEQWPGTVGTSVGVYQPCCHYGAGLDFGPDGKLWLTPGDKFSGEYAQDRASSAGSIIRVNPDGTVPDGTDGWPANPYINNSTGWDESIWAYGLRNPYRARWDLPTGRFFVGEVGGNDQARSWEDLHLAKAEPDYAGLDYGWPRCEGPAPYTDFPNCDIAGTRAEPIYAYKHTDATPNGGSITGGFVYRGSAFPSQYYGAYFFGDYALEHIRYITFDPSDPDVVTGDFDFQPAAGSIVALEQGPDGALYYAQISGGVRRIVYDGLVVTASATPTSGLAPLDVSFDGAATSGSGALTYTWNFGDGTTASGLSDPAISHTYAADGLYTAVLEASDGTKTAQSEPIPIEVGEPPTATILAPVDGALFRAGDVISFNGDSDVDPGHFVWNVRFGHNDHFHPVLDDYVGTSGSFSIPTSGHDYADETRYEIELTVTDETGLAGTDVVNIYPDKVNVTYETVPAGIPVTVDAIARTTPFVIDDLKGFERTISAPVTRCVDGVLYEFVSWSDGGNREHMVVVPDGDVTLTASFTSIGDCALPVTAGLVAQWESDAGVSASGSVVSGWSDQSGAGNDLSAGGDPELVTGATPSGRSAIRLDGSGDQLTRQASTDPITGLPAGRADRSVFAVVSYRASTTWAGVAYGKGDYNRAFGLAVNGAEGNLMLQGWGTGQDLVSTATGAGAGWLVQSAVLSGSAATLYRDGASVASWTHSYDTVVERIAVGVEIKDLGHMDMDVAAVLIYDRALSEVERQQVEQYLQEKYLAGTAPPTASVSITSPSDGATVTGPDVTVSWDATAAASGDHVHLTLDGGPDYVAVMDLQGSYTFTDLADGAHTVSAEMASSDHVIYTNPEASDAVSFTVSSGVDAITPAGLIPLFDGQSLDGLYPWFASSGFSDPKQIFTVENGLLRVGGDEVGALTTNAAYQDYVMVLEFKWGTQTWAPRADKAKDGGLIFHSNGSEGDWQNLLMPGLQMQILQGGMGDLIILDNLDGSMAFTSNTEQLTCTYDTWNCRGGYRWASTGAAQIFDTDMATQHWADWDPDWQDLIGFQGDNDIESPDGDWNQAVVIARGDTVEVYFNGVKVNEATDVFPAQGKIQLEAELAEYFVRRWDLLPLGSSVGPMIVSTALASGTEGMPYSDSIDAVGMAAPLTWSLASGTLPDGVSLDASTGAISGTPSAAGSYSFSVEVADAQGTTATAPFDLSIQGTGSGLVTDGLVLHLEADLNVTTNGGNVGGWLDQSGNGNDLTAGGDPQLVSGATPSGQPAIQFDGTGDLLERTATLNNLPAGSADRTLFAVIRYDAAEKYAGVAYGDGTFNEAFGLVVNGGPGRLAVQGWGSSHDLVSDAAGSGAGWLVQSVRLSSGEVTHYLDGTVIDTGTRSYATDAQRIAIGEEIGGLGDGEALAVSAVLIYDRALSEAERQQVEQHLQNKYLGGTPANTAPSLTAIDDQTVEEGQPLEVAVSATDAEGDPIGLSVALVDDASGTAVDASAYTFTDNGDGTGAFSWTPGAGAAGTYTATVTATDGTASTTEAFAITVSAPAGVASITITAPNDGATLTGSSLTVEWAATAAAAGDHVHLTLNGNAPVDDQSLEGTYTFTGLSAGTYTMVAEVASADHVVYTNAEATDSVSVTLESGSGSVPYATDLALHLESDAGVSASGSVVSGWSDQSGAGNDLSAGGDPELVTGATPSGRSAIRLDGSGDQLTRQASTDPITGLPAGRADRSVFAVVSYRASTTWAGVAYGKGDYNRAFGLAVNGAEGNLMLQGWGTGQDLVSTATGAGAGWLVQSAVLSGSAATLYRDGASVASWTHSYDTVVERIAVGVEIKDLGHMDMDVAAVLIYDRALSEVERQQVEQYLQEKYLGGTFSATSSKSGTATASEVATAFAVHGVYPNPSSTAAFLAFDLVERTDVRVDIYDIMGRRVLQLNESGVAAGVNRTLQIDASRLSSGVYLYRLTASTPSGPAMDTGRFTVVR